MIMKETDFKKHLSSKQYSNVYFIDGEEKMLVAMYTDALVKKLMGDNPPQFNYHVFDNNCEISDVSVACDVVPFMSDKNCVKIVDLDFDSLDTADINSYIQIIKNIPDTTTLIFSMPTNEKKPKPTAKYKKICDAVSKVGVVCELSKRSQLSIEKTVCKWADDCGSKINPVVASKLIKICSSDLKILKNEIEKLSAFAGEGEITEQMIEMLVSKNLEAKIYDLFDYVIANDFDKAMNTVDVLFYHREEPVAIVIALGSAYVDMYRARVATESSIPIKVFADELSYKNRAWVLEKMSRTSKNIPVEVLRASIDEILSLNERMVSVPLNHRVEIEKLISRLILIAKGQYHGTNK